MPTIAIYQDASYIEGILQQASRGLITDSSQADDFRNTKTSVVDTTGKGELGADIRLPGVGGFKASAQVSAGDETTLEGVAGQQLVRNFKYTSAYYLHQVRLDLQAAGLLKSLVTARDLRGLVVGDFVEFQATFKPDELIALMDVLNPDLVAALVRWVRRNQILPNIVNAEADEQKQGSIIEYQTRPEADAEFAKAIAEAVRVDFRSLATREYFGTIAGDPQATAVVVCDTRSFLVEDADRILDGHFTVFGKVSTPPESDVPILARNKVLDRIQPSAVDLLAKELRNLARQRIESPDSLLPGDGTLDQYLDLNFPSRIEGISFKVVPIAIYI